MSTNSGLRVVVLPVVFGAITGAADIGMIQMGWYADSTGWTGLVSALAGVLSGYVILLHRKSHPGRQEGER